MQLNGQLQQAAFLHSKDMSEQNYFSHISNNGLSFVQRITQQSYIYSYLGENIAYHYGQPSADKVFMMRKNSQGHYTNMMSPNFNEAGLGIFYDRRRTFYTLDLVKSLEKSILENKTEMINDTTNKIEGNNTNASKNESNTEEILENNTLNEKIILNYAILNRKIEFFFNTTNADKIIYIDNEERRPREKKICYHNENICKRKIMLRRGLHNFTFIKESENATIFENLIFDL